MELDNRDEELDIERVSEHYYSSGLYYNSSSQVNLNFNLEQVEKENMSGTFTLSKDLTNALYGSVLEKIFKEFSGKKVGEEFSIEEVMKYFDLNDNNSEKKEESQEEGETKDETKDETKVESKKVEKKKVEKKKKEKVVRKMSGYGLFQKKNKEEIQTRWNKEKETDKEIKFLTVASILWKELGTEEQEKYKIEAKNM